MRILLICGGLMPDACVATGVQDRRVNGGFMGAMLSALFNASPDNEFCVLSWDARKCDVHLGRVWHVSFGGGNKSYTNGLTHGQCVRAQQIISLFKPDVIHVLGTEGVFTSLPTCVFGGRPVVVSMQGVIAACAIAYAGGLTPHELRGTNFNLSYFRRGMTIFKEQAFWRDVRASHEAEIIRRHKYFIGRTDFDESWVRYYNPEARYYHVDEIMRAAFYDVPRDPNRIVRHRIFCGGAAGYPLKGAHWLMRAIAALKGPYPDIELSIANAEWLRQKNAAWKSFREGSYAKYLRRMMRDLDVRERIVAYPALSAESVVTELQKAELFVLPSLCENSPNALCEAMLVGTPAVAFSVGGVPSFIKDGLNGKLVPPADPAGLASAIRECFEHGERFREYARRAQVEARLRHDPEKVAARQLEVYSSIVEEG